MSEDKTEDKVKVEKLQLIVERYNRALHALQGGVATMMNYTHAHEPKHLRVGVDSALVTNAALVHLLVFGLILYW